MTKRKETPRFAPKACLRKDLMRTILDHSDEIRLKEYDYINLRINGADIPFPEGLSFNGEKTLMELMADYEENEDKYINRCKTNKNNRNGGEVAEADERPTNDRQSSDERPPNKNSNQNKSNQNKPNQIEKINNESESNSISHGLNSDSYSKSRPNNVEEVLRIANGKGWDVTHDEAERWFKQNEDSGWISYKTHEPISNWIGTLKNWLNAQRQTEYDKICVERTEQLGEKNALTLGIDAELDKRLYSATKKLSVLNPKNDALKEDMTNYERHYTNKADEDEQPF